MAKDCESPSLTHHRSSLTPPLLPPLGEPFLAAPCAEREGTAPSTDTRGLHVAAQKRLRGDGALPTGRVREGNGRADATERYVQTGPARRRAASRREPSPACAAPGRAGPRSQVAAGVRGAPRPPTNRRRILPPPPFLSPPKTARAVTAP